MDGKRLDWTDWLAIVFLIAIGWIALVYVPLGWQGVANLLHSEVLAGWVQALGSIVGLGVAIWIPAMQRAHEHRQQREQDLVEAHIAAASVALTLNPAIGFARAFLDQVEQAKAGYVLLNARKHLSAVDALLKPTDEQLKSLQAISTAVVLSVTRGFRHLDQMKLVLVQRSNDTDLIHSSRDLADLLPTSAEIVVDQLESASREILAFMEKMEGRE